MIKTLRITTIIAAVLAVIFFVLPMVFGGRNDEKIEQFLSSTGIVEKFNKEADNKAKTSKSQTSPLVMQAELFAKYLNPPEPVPSTPAVPQPTISPPQPRVYTPKFTLLGTSVYTAQPEMSLAFIDEPGKGLRWVKQGGQVEHITIKEVKEGLVVLQDGQRTFEISAQQQPEQSLIEGRQGAQGAGPGPAITTSDESVTAAAISEPPELSDERIRDFMKSIQADINSGEIDSQSADKILSAIGSMRISDDEAEKLKDLPEKQLGQVPGLRHGEAASAMQAGDKSPDVNDPNQAKKPNIERPQRPRRLNLPSRR
jgi:hypothetical protein